MRPPYTPRLLAQMTFLSQSGSIWGSPNIIVLYFQNGIGNPIRRIHCKTRDESDPPRLDKKEIDPLWRSGPMSPLETDRQETFVRLRGRLTYKIQFRRLQSFELACGPFSGSGRADCISRQNLARMQLGAMPGNMMWPAWEKWWGRHSPNSAPRGRMFLTPLWTP